MLRRVVMLEATVRGQRALMQRAWGQIGELVRAMEQAGFKKEVRTEGGVLTPDAGIRRVTPVLRGPR